MSKKTPAPPAGRRTPPRHTGTVIPCYCWAEHPGTHVHCTEEPGHAGRHYHPYTKTSW